jgi:hypothetical protein
MVNMKMRPFSAFPKALREIIRRFNLERLGMSTEAFAVDSLQSRSWTREGRPYAPDEDEEIITYLYAACSDGVLHNVIPTTEMRKSLILPAGREEYLFPRGAQTLADSQPVQPWPAHLRHVPASASALYLFQTDIRTGPISEAEPVATPRGIHVEAYVEPDTPASTNEIAYFAGRQHRLSTTSNFPSVVVAFAIAFMGSARPIVGACLLNSSDLDIVVDRRTLACLSELYGMAGFSL